MNTFYRVNKYTFFEDIQYFITDIFQTDLELLDQFYSDCKSKFLFLVIFGTLSNLSTFYL